LISSLLLNEDVPLLRFSIAIKLCLLSLVVIKSVPLRHRLLRELLILIMNVSLDLLDISLGVLLSL